MRQRGTSLIELVIVVAVAVLVAVALWALPQGGRSFGSASAAGQFDAAIGYARALAANSGNGATMVFDRRTWPLGSPVAGFTLTVYSGRPTAAGALKKAPMAPMISTGDVRESKLGSVPFTVFLDGAGHASAMRGTVGAASSLASDPGCPSGESAVVLTFTDPRAWRTRSIVCNSALAGAPVVLGTVAPDAGASPITVTPAPAPTPAATVPPAPVPALTASPSAAPTPIATPSQAPTPLATPVSSPNPVCTPDPLGWCAAVASRRGTSITCYYWDAAAAKRYKDQQYEPSTTYNVYDRGLLLYVDTGTWIWNRDCPPTSAEQWTPGEPRVQSGDSNLP